MCAIARVTWRCLRPCGGIREAAGSCTHSDSLEPMGMAVPEFPTNHPLPPREPKKVRTAVLLALFFGPLGLFYASVPGGVFCTFLLIVLGLFTVGVGILPVWGVSLLWAYLAASHSQVSASACRSAKSVVDPAGRSLSSSLSQCQGRPV